MKEKQEENKEKGEGKMCAWSRGRLDVCCKGWEFKNNIEEVQRIF